MLPILISASVAPGSYFFCAAAGGAIVALASTTRLANKSTAQMRIVSLFNLAVPPLSVTRVNPVCSFDHALLRRGCTTLARFASARISPDRPASARHPKESGRLSYLRFLLVLQRILDRGERLLE